MLINKNLKLLKMKSLFNCELHYFPSRHLSHIYDGFEKLRKTGIINVSIKRAPKNQTKPLLKVIVNNKFKVIYDTLDGFNWVDGSIEDNLKYFKNNITADFYFKRSYNNQIANYIPDNCRVFPLGLYFAMKPEGNYPDNFNNKLKDFVRENHIISKYYSKTSFKRRDFEYYPIPSKDNKILFLTQLWNPNDTKFKHLKEERELINRNRIDCIKGLQKEFGNKFFGGLQHNSFSTSSSKSLILPASNTKREYFLNSIKNHNICITTTGLHNSIGSKFGEYIAASRAIVTEPLNYELPGSFSREKNYFEFNDSHKLIESVHKLMNSEVILYNMMKSNYHYYNNYVRTDSLILNTLLKISNIH